MTASPWPPPEQIAAQPRPPPRRRSSWTSTPRMRAPDAPIGWPRATAPPLTLTRSSSMPSIRIVFRVTEANASLTSHRSMSLGCRPALSSAFIAARPGVVDARRVARGVRALLADQPGQLGEHLERGVAARGLVDLDDGLLALAALDGHRDELVGHAAVVGGGDRALVRAQRPLVEVGPRELELVADLGRLVVHLAAAERVGQPVVDHRVQRLGVAHPVAEAG